MDNPTTIVIFGATGDLTARKLIPALRSLESKGRLPDSVRIVGVARSEHDDESFRTLLEETMPGESSQDSFWKTFRERIYYTVGDTTKDGGLDALVSRLHDWEPETGSNRLFYLALAPRLYPDSISRLAKLDDSSGGWTRVIIEKPFGRDLGSARELNQLVSTEFDEEQLYRIDHYLGKETVQNLLVFRFSNTLFEPLWNSKYIDHVQIVVDESGLVGDRGSYYDRAGVLRDMFQNHLFQLLAVVAMEPPSKFEATALRDEKLAVLQSIEIPPPEEARTRLVLGQYEGYRDEEGIDDASRTPTFAALELRIDNDRWRGVPFFLRSGKGLQRRHSEIIIQFTCAEHSMFRAEQQEVACNRLSICVQPDEGIHLNFQTKVPDRETMVLRAADMEFHYRNTFGENSIPEAYERLLQDSLDGDASLFMRADEIERAWEILTPYLEIADNDSEFDLHLYPRGSFGPEATKELLAESGRAWQSLCEHEH